MTIQLHPRIGSAVRAVTGDGATRSPFDRATVVVSSISLGNSLARRLLSREGGTLHGVEFVTPVGLVSRLLRAAGQPFAPAGKWQREFVLDRMLSSRAIGGLRYHDADQLARRSGYAVAIVGAIDECEANGITPDDLDATAARQAGLDGARLADLATIWKALDSHRTASGLDCPTTHGATAAAVAAVRQDPGIVARVFGDLRAILIGLPAPLLLDLLTAAGAAIAWVSVPPLRHAQARVEAMASALQATIASAPAASADTDLRRLQVRLLTDIGDSPSALPADGSVGFEAYRSAAEELDAAVEFVVAEIARGVPLHEIAIAAPQPDPLLPMLADRLKHAGVSDGIATVLIGERPLESTPGGRRARQLLDAIADHLSLASVSSIIRHSRVRDDEAVHRASWSTVRYLSEIIGAPGGLPGLESQYRSHVERARLALEHLAEGSRERELVERYLPLLEDLTELVEHAGSDDVAALLAGLDAFAQRWMHDNAQSAVERVTGTVRGALQGSVASGSEMLKTLDHFLSVSRAAGSGWRVGQPAVTLAPIHAVAGMTFRSLRILGLCDGVYPSENRQDPILPDELRRALSGRVTGADGQPMAIPMPLSSERAESDRRAFVAAVRTATERIRLSYPAMTISGTRSAPSSLLLEAAGCLPRDDKEPGMPDPATFQRLYVVSDMERIAQQHAASMMRPASLLAAVARGRHAQPTEWTDDTAASTTAAAHLLAAQCDGSECATATNPIGLEPERPVSASRLGMLLACPRRFHFDSVLRLREEFGPPEPIDRLPPREFGTQVHALIEHVMNETGAEGWSAMRADWSQRRTGVRDLLRLAFMSRTANVPFSSPTVANRERDRVVEAAMLFLRHDLATARDATFVGCELAFGMSDDDGSPVPGLPITLRDDLQLFVRGRIDRVDRTPAGLMVRDIKSGKGHPFRGNEARPLPGVDLQIGLYALVAPQVVEGGQRVDSAAYVYLGPGQAERRYGPDAPFDVARLTNDTRNWLELAADLLLHGRFPRTPDPASDCRYCPFSGACPGSCQEAAVARHKDGKEQDNAVNDFLAFRLELGTTGSKKKGRA
ncbi:MAG: PD-(D/E)XK nuclease family protein [Planctomycetota bacterium]